VLGLELQRADQTLEVLKVVPDRHRFGSCVVLEVEVIRELSHGQSIGFCDQVEGQGLGKVARVGGLDGFATRR